MMADDDWYKPHRPPAPARRPQAGELLFEFVRRSDRAPMSCELRFQGESYGWEAQFFERGEIFVSRGGFALRELAVRWADAERRAISGQPCAHFGGGGWMDDPAAIVPAPITPTVLICLCRDHQNMKNTKIHEEENGLSSS